jgi:hypothetical protein
LGIFEQVSLFFFINSTINFIYLALSYEYANISLDNAFGHGSLDLYFQMVIEDGIRFKPHDRIYTEYRLCFTSLVAY